MHPPPLATQAGQGEVLPTPRTRPNGPLLLETGCLTRVTENVCVGLRPPRGPRYSLRKRMQPRASSATLRLLVVVMQIMKEVCAGDTDLPRAGWWEVWDLSPVSVVAGRFQGGPSDPPPPTPGGTHRCSRRDCHLQDVVPRVCGSEHKGPGSWGRGNREVFMKGIKVLAPRGD